MIPKLISTLNTFIVTGKNARKIDKLGNDVIRKIFNLKNSSTIKPLYVQAGLLPFNTQLHISTVNLLLRILATDTPCSDLVRDIGLDVIPLKSNWTKYCLRILESYGIHGAENWLKKGIVTRENVTEIQRMVKRQIEKVKWEELKRDCSYMTAAEEMDLTMRKFKKVAPELEAGNTYFSIRAKTVKSWILSGSYKHGKWNSNELCTYCGKENTRRRWKHYVECEFFEKKLEHLIKGILKTTEDEELWTRLKKKKHLLKFLLNPANTTLKEEKFELNDKRLPDLREKADWFIYSIHNVLKLSYEAEKDSSNSATDNVESGFDAENKSCF